jgi:hypothetical protein
MHEHAGGFGSIQPGPVRVAWCGAKLRATLHWNGTHRLGARMWYVPWYNVCLVGIAL